MKEKKQVKKFRSYPMSSTNVPQFFGALSFSSSYARTICRCHPLSEKKQVKTFRLYAMSSPNVPQFFWSYQNELMGYALRMGRG